MGGDTWLVSRVDFSLFSSAGAWVADSVDPTSVLPVEEAVGRRGPCSTVSLLLSDPYKVMSDARWYVDSRTEK